MSREKAILRLARQIDAAKKAERFLVNPNEVMALRREGASTLHRTCADFVASLNSGLADATVELSPPTYAPEMFREPGANLIQISSQGRQMQIAFEAPSQLVSTEKFGTPYLLEGEVRTFNQRMLERFEIRSLLIFFCVENETGSWRFFDGWVTLGGALSTGSHGSGPPSISSIMIGCRLVTANGAVVEIGENDERLDAVRLSMGMLGILSTVTLRVVDTFYVKLSQTRIPTKDWKRFLREGEMSYMLWFFPEGEKIGPVHEILMSFEAIGPIAGAEWAVPAPRFDAAMADLEREMANGLYLPAPVWLKKVKPETAWLSAADEECVQCGIYHNVNPGTPWHVREMVTRVERLMLRHGGRPHLGKLIYLDPADLKSVYPNWQKFDAPRREMDPTGVFWTVL